MKGSSDSMDCSDAFRKMGCRFRGHSEFTGREILGAGSLPILLLILLVLWPVTAGASWFIDPLKYHVSAHGQTPCQDCHESHSDRTTHPDPDNVARTLEDFFTQESCFSCHDNVPDDLEEGTHGTISVQNPKDYQECLSCHDPHLEPLREASGKGLNLARPLEGQCHYCHDEKVEALPAPPEDEGPCFDCHVIGSVTPEERAERINRFCLECHGDAGKDIQRRVGRKVQLIRVEDYPNTQHSKEACTECHPQAPDYGHNNQQPGDCSQCHVPHDAKVANSVHLKVACGSCHLPGIEPYRDHRLGLVLWRFQRTLSKPLKIHEMIKGKGHESCRRCHRRENPLGAASMILPPKSILCMPCHSGTLSAGDWTTLVSLVFFLGGLAAVFSLLIQGFKRNRDAEHIDVLGPRSPERKDLWIKVYLPLKAILWDVLLQRRLFRASLFRWLIHGLIFFPMIFRLLWGILALATSLLRPQWGLPWIMLDKDHPVTAALFDLTGIMILFGTLVAVGVEVIKRRNRLPGLPEKDLLVTGLVAVVAILGFALEAVRIAMSGVPELSSSAFVGHWLSGLFTGRPWLQGFYGYLWYAHAILTGVFIAVIPFSRLLHIITAPLLLLTREG